MAKRISKYRFNYLFLFWFIFSTLTFIFFFSYNSFASTQVLLEWTPNNEPDLAGYKMFCREEGLSYEYSNPSWEGTDNYCTIYDLDETKTYCFVARAYDSEGFESGDSDEVCYGAALSGNTKEVRVATGSDDAEEYASGEMYLTSSDLEMVYDNSGDQAVGMRFNGVDIPQGATIINAYIQFKVDEISSGATFLAIEGEDIDNAQTFDSSDLNISSRSRTNSYVSWSPPAWETVGEAGFDQRTSDISSIIQEIVNRSGWSSGNSLVVIITGTGERVAESYNGDQNGAPQLHVEYNTDTTPDNHPPIADAGPDQTVDEGRSVILSGANSTDPDDGIASYHWVQTGGYPVILSDPDGQQRTFSAPKVDSAVALIFELTVVDHSGLESTDSCVVNVAWQNEPPQADAGPDQTVIEGAVVTLDGSASLDIDDGIDFYSWTQTKGPTVTLLDPASSRPTFSAPDVGPAGVSLTFDLTVTDTGELKDTDSCIVNITWQNHPPTAVVAPDYMEPIERTLVALDGSASMDPDDGIASHLWTQVEGDPVSIADPTSAVATFTAPKTDQYGKNLKFKLTVKDFGGLQGTADSSVYVRQNELPNNPPSADFDVVISRKKASFTDYSSPDGTIVSWFWDFGDEKTSAERNPKHKYVKFSDYLVTLTVTDDKGATHSLQENITIMK